MKSLVNQTIAERYHCQGRIGSGGMGLVYLAEDLTLHRKVVLKTLNPRQQSEKATSRFLREAKILSQLNHPHIVTIYDFGIWNENMFIVLEFLEGTNLQNIIENKGTLSTAWIMTILPQILDALQSAHQAGIVHRDLKPSNIFCLPMPDQTDFIKILDFGTAISRTQGLYEKITTSGEVLGTPQYMSPEQIMGREDINERSDIYSLGVILYEMLTGNPPFSGDSTMSILLGHLYKIPAEIEKWQTDDDPQRLTLHKIAEICLNKNPVDRFSDIENVRDLLNQTPINAGRLLENFNQDRQVRFKQFYQGPIRETRYDSDDTEIWLMEPHREFCLWILEPEETPIERSLIPLLKIARYRVEHFPSLDIDTLKCSSLPDAIVFNKNKEENLRLLGTLLNTNEPGFQSLTYLVCGPEGDLDYISKSIETGASDYLSYPFDPGDILKKIDPYSRLKP